MKVVMPECTILVAAHKPYWMPEDPAYLPVQVGSAGKPGIGFARDDEGENISTKNPWYCELTAVYWAWKNLSAEYIGLAHYRRHFTEALWSFVVKQKQAAVLSGTRLSEELRRYPLLLPRRRNYIIQKRRAHFIKAHGAGGLAAAEQAIEILCPEYLPAYDRVMDRTWGHVYNMFVMRRDLFNAYCAWLFALLGEAEKRLSPVRGGMQPRILGFLAERLLDVWVEHQALPYREVDYIFMETMNWPLKILRFLQRKYLRQATSESR